jgi:hypothetical protein|tara:strand:+ start:324 stop:551 length:228 start_codon:yes stop_codon:yes gene_type:complete
MLYIYNPIKLNVMSNTKTLLEGTQDDDKYLDDEYQAKSQRGFKPSPHDIVLTDFFEYLFTGKREPKKRNNERGNL